MSTAMLARSAPMRRPLVAAAAGRAQQAPSAAAVRTFGTVPRANCRPQPPMLPARMSAKGGGRHPPPPPPPSDAVRLTTVRTVRSSSGRRRKSTAVPLSESSSGGGGGGAARSARQPPPPPPPPHTSPPPPRESGLRDLYLALREGLHEILLRPRTLSVPRWITPKRFTVTYSECFGHASFILVAASYAVDDFLTLRCVAVVGSTAMLLFTYFHPHGRVLWLPFKWNVLFIAINSYRIGRVVFQRYQSELLTDEMKRIHKEHFFVMDLEDFAKLIRLGTEETYEAGALVVAQNDTNRYIRLVLSGEVEVMRDGVVTYVLREANFISETGLHVGLMLRDQVESCCSIIARRRRTDTHQGHHLFHQDTMEGHQLHPPGKVRLMRWDRTELMELLDREPQLRRSIKAALSWDIIRKLKGQRQLLVAGSVTDPERWTVKRKEQNDDRYAAILSNVLHHSGYRSSYVHELNKYRIIHHIDDEKHRVALERCGWTPEEFRLGTRHASEEEEEEEEDVGHDWKWRMTSMLARVLG